VAATPERIHHAFFAQAARTPDAPALHSAHGVCSYGELANIARAIARQLHARGIGPGATVAIYADRNPALVFCLLGVAQAGASFQLLDAAYPLPRILACVQQSRPAFLLIAGDPTLPDALPAALGMAGPEQLARVPAQVQAAQSALASAFPGGTPADVALAAPPLASDDAVAYVSFTSGSTGTPKGILTGHAPLPHFVRWHVAHGQLSADDRFSMLSGLGHDPLLRDIFTPLAIGASLHIPTQPTLFDADALYAWFASEQITVAHMTPAFGEILLTGAGEGALPRLRRVYWGGDVLRIGLVRALARVAPGVQQTNFYGATETPQAMAYFDLSELGPAPSDDVTIPIGRGIDGAQLLVVDEQARLCEVGEVGEIWIRSPYLSLGYLDGERGGASAQDRFVTSPFSQRPDDRCYRTGDRGRYRDDGAVLFAGRADHQIKLRGFRIEPAEIVVALERLPAVRRALVLAKELHGDKQLVAYVTHRAAPAPSVAALRAALQAELPSYMVPRHFVPLAELPLLPNGKVDLLALPTPGPATTADAQVAPASAARRLPRTDAERQMAAIWAELLGVDEVGIDQSFLDLGGDSLSAIRALSRMRRLGISENVARGIFQGRTIAELASGEGEGSAPSVPTHSLRRSGRTTLLINVMRGFLVLTLVADHWKEGFFKRFPRIPATLVHGIEPLFDLPTPGFAFVFGIGLAYSQYENYLKNPTASRRMMRGGALVLTLGTVLMGLSRNLGVVARGLPLDYDLFCTNFFLPTLYYLLAMFSAPLWFAALQKREGKRFGSMGAALLLALGSRVLYEVCRLLLLEREQVGLLQLGRLMLTARFSYFNLSTGALLGVFFGLYLRREKARDNLTSLLSWSGLGVGSAGLLLFYARRDVLPDGLSSPDILLPKWLVYVGVTLLLGALFEALLVWARPRLVRSGLQWLGVVGQCAMPIFILQGVALDVSAFGRALGLPDKAATALAVGSFVLTVGWMMRRIHALYYGVIAVDPSPGAAGAAATSSRA
jgi:amino acid adenylation domain-containing protein